MFIGLYMIGRSRPRRFLIAVLFRKRCDIRPFSPAAAGTGRLGFNSPPEMEKNQLV